MRLRLASCLVLAFLLRGVAAQCGVVWQPAQGDPIATPLGSVRATLAWDPDGAGPLPTCFTVGGRFAVADAPLCHVAYHDGSVWRTLPALPQATAEARLLTVYNGALIAGTKGAIYQWTGTAWTMLGGMTSGLTTQALHAVAVFQGSLFVGGFFNAITPTGSPGNATPGIARWDGANWSAVGTATGTPTVTSLAVLGGSLYVGGSFASIGGTTASNLATWNGTTWAAYGDPNGAVTSLAVRSAASVSANLLFAGGTFSQIGGIAAAGVARVQASVAGAAWIAMNGLPATYAQDGVLLAVQPSGLTGYACFAATGGGVRSWGGAAWSAMYDVPAAPVVALGLRNGQPIVGVARTTPPTTSGAALFDGGAGVQGEGIRGRVLAVADFAGQTVIAGDFQQIGATTCRGIAIGSANAWQPMGGGLAGAGGAVRALLVHDGALYAAGAFTVATGAPADGIARWNGASWVPVGAGLAGPVHALAVGATGELYAGGAFTASGATNVRGLARWTGSAWIPLFSGLDGNVGAPVVDHLVARDGLLYMGGSFTTAGPQALVVGNVAACVLATGAWLALTRSGFATPGVPGVATMAATDAGVAIAYATNDPAWQAIGRVAGTSIVPFAASGVTTLRATDVQAILQVPGGVRFLHRGTFEEIQGTNLALATTAALVRWDGDSASATAAELRDGDRGALAFAASGDLLVGGLVTGGLATTGFVVRAGFGALRSTCPATAAPYGIGCGSPSSSSVPDQSVEQLPWLGGTCRIATTGIQGSVLNVAIAAVGVAPVAVPLAAILPVGGPCSLLVDPLVTVTLTPTAGVVRHQFGIPNAAALVGQQVRDQVVRVDFGANGIDGLAASQALTLTLGSAP